MSVEAVVGLLYAALGGLALIVIKHLITCGERRREIGEISTKLDTLIDEVAKVRRGTHRHTADIGKLAHKLNVDLGNER